MNWLRFAGVVVRGRVVSMAKCSIGDRLFGVLLETFQEAGISRRRVRPVESFPSSMRVEFPRKLRDEHPVGTRFRATVTVAQKHNSDGSIRGNPYLIADRASIQLDMK